MKLCVLTFHTSTIFLNRRICYQAYLFFSRFYRAYSKKTAQWVVTPSKVPKTYPHIAAIQKSILAACMSDEQSMSRKLVLTEDDPRKIAPNIAPIPPPVPTKELAKRRQSRFKKSHVVFADSACDPTPSTSKAADIDTEEELMPATSEEDTAHTFSSTDTTD